MVVIGGGTAGWISAALLVKILGNALKITVVESEQIGTIGVGEATIPPILSLNRALGFDEADFIRATRATIKLGIEFEHWGRIGARYMHAFGSIGKDFPFCGFHHFWTRSLGEGRREALWDYSLNYQSAKRNRFAPLEQLEIGKLPGLVHAYHFDAGLYAAYLRAFSERLGVRRIEGLITHANLDPATGGVQSVQLQGGGEVAGDLFIDCSGFRGLLIEQALNTGYEDWSHWLPCDRALAVACESAEPLAPYTRAIAHPGGWQWRIPLQHRTGNGLVYCSKYLSDEEARALLLANLDAAPLGEPRPIPFRTGRRTRQWNHNVVSIGLASGFLEPLESTSIHLIQSGVIRLIKHFPHAGITPAEIDEYNRQSQAEFEHIRDFLILHYWQNDRPDSEFWRECRNREPPPSLQQRIELFETTGKLFRAQDELFGEQAWQQVMIGQGIMPRDYHPLADSLTTQQLDELLDGVRAIIQRAVDGMGSHRQFIERCCRPAAAPIA
ncbi:MAG: tryptophan 7-halogenase [Rudaea sp.]|uniref:tryptophan halogenase family protein n=1 Tax=Rudaea sp. TaxID=2136325 RepID=UPI0039E487D9